jgi:hypothetical protein
VASVTKDTPAQQQAEPEEMPTAVGDMVAAAAPSALFMLMRVLRLCFLPCWLGGMH